MTTNIKLAVSSGALLLYSFALICSYQSLLLVDCTISIVPSVSSTQPPLASQQQSLSNEHDHGTSSRATKISTQNNCSAACTNQELQIILSKLITNEDLKLSQESSANDRSPVIREKCVKQLIGMIKDLATGELEMKTLLEFASSTLPLDRKLDLSSLRSSYASDRVAANEPLVSGQSDCPTGADSLNNQLASNNQILGDDAPTSPSASLEDSKTKLLPKFVANVDHWIDTLNRFTLTREWSALMKIFNGAESIMNMFSKSITSASNGLDPSKTKTSNTKTSQITIPEARNEEFLIKLEHELPIEIQTLTSSLNQLFPWHVWPWNNVDLYSTLDTFLNHGIFAFSKTTSGPERRIDYISPMLDGLFKSLKFESFPKKCDDWSRIICDLEAFHDRLALAPAIDTSDQANNNQSATKRREQVAELTKINDNKLTQELTCIMFSSLSMQQFGAKDNVDFKSMFESGNETIASKNQLQWDKMARKALRLYRLSREALTDDQWRGLYKQVQESVSTTKISDRVIMIGRIVQLLTNCHMPHEILESALWKDIYKYKNALNQISDIVIEELNRSSENGQFTIKQLSIGSKHLEDILTRFMRLLPRLIEAISKTITDGLPELVNKFFNEKVGYLKGPCKGYSFGDLIPSLKEHRQELVELEQLVCRQLSTKPNITMAQINNLTNDFLAMVFNANFTSSLGGSLQSALPKFWAAPISGAIQKVPTFGPGAVKTNTHFPMDFLMENPNVGENKNNNNNRIQNTTASIVDELAANPRLAQIVAILQSSALDPPEVHAELPELDWVEAGTSLALFYETIQRLISFEGVFMIFPEISEFQDDLGQRSMVSKNMFKRFGKRDVVHLVAYSLDTAMPVALRTFQPLDSFHSECLATFRDIFGDVSSFDNNSPSSSSSGPLPASSSSSASPAAPSLSAPASSITSPQPVATVPNVTPHETRQWQCAISSINFASYALNNLIKTFDVMLKSIMNQLTQQRIISQQQKSYPTTKTTSASTTKTTTNTTTTTTDTCVLFDGSITTLMDNLPHIVELTLETVLIASTNPQPQHSQHVIASAASAASTTATGGLVGNVISQQLHTSLVKNTLCSKEPQILDPFGDQVQLQHQQKLRQAICHLLHESSLATCGEALKVSVWTNTMRELNLTWFESPATRVEPSFRGILDGVHEFLELFGKVKPSSMSDGLIARVLNFNSYWTTLVNKATVSFENYRDKRFELALQVLVPILDETILPTTNQSTGTQTDSRQALKLSIVGAKSVYDYITREGSPANATIAAAAAASTTTAVNGTTDLALDRQLKTLFDIADRYSVAMAESVLRTVANNVTKLERLVGSNESSTKLWAEFCSSPADTYFEFEPMETSNGNQNKAALPSQARYVDMSSARDSLCRFEWANFDSQLLKYGTNEPQSKPGSSKETNISLFNQLDQYSSRQLVRIALTKWGQVLDLIMESGSRKTTHLPRFLTLTHWKSIQEKLPQITPLKDEPTNFSWLWLAFEQLVLAYDNARSANDSSTTVSANTMHESLVKTFDQLNCALDSVKGGLTWDNIINIYQDRQDILAAHSTLNNGVALASAGANTFLAHKKFQRFLNDFVKPKIGLSAFCDMRDKSRLEMIFVQPDGQEQISKGDSQDLSYALGSFQEFICDTNLDTLIQNLNPITYCYLPPGGGMQNNNNNNNSTANATTNETTTTTTTTTKSWQSEGALSDTIDRFFKLASLAILDAKLTETIDAKPPIFDKSKWDNLRVWWLNQTEVHQGNSGLALTLVRIFQTLDSINSEHVVWKAIFRSVYEMSEISAYLLRAAELVSRSSQVSTTIETAPAAIIETARVTQTPAATKTDPGALNLRGLGQQRLASTLTNVMFPEANNFISFRTFKQLRYLKSISDYFVQNHKAQQSLCRNLTQLDGSPSSSSSSSRKESTTTTTTMQGDRFELINYQLDSSEKLYSLLCHYDSAQWLTALNIVLSRRTVSLSKKANYMTKYLSMFTRNFRDNENLQSFIHGQQLENIEAVANTTVVYLIALSRPFRTLKISKISNMSWHSLPSLLEQIDGHLCLSKFDGNSSAYDLVVYEPKKPDIETLLCKIPTSNISQVYNYISENIDLQNMISLVAQNNRTAAIFGIKLGGYNMDNNNGNVSEAHEQQSLGITSLGRSNITTSTSTNLTTSNSVRQQQQQQQQLNQTGGQYHSNTTIRKTCITPFKIASKWLNIVQDLIDETMSKGSRERIRKCLGAKKKNQSFYNQSLRFLKLFNSVLTTLNDLTVNNSWHYVRRTWSSISFALLNQSNASGAQLPSNPSTPVTKPF